MKRPSSLITTGACFACLAGLALAAPAYSEQDGVPPGIRASADRFRAKVERHRNDELYDAVDYFQEVAEWAFTLRAETQAFTKALDGPSGAQALTGAQLERLRRGTVEHLAVRDEILALVESYSHWVEPSATVPTEDQRLKGVMLSLAGALVLYDNFAYAVELVHQDTRLRRIANRPDQSFALGAGELFESAQRYYSEADRDRARRAVAAMESSAERLQRLATIDPQVAYLASVIDESAFRTRLEDTSFLNRLAASVRESLSLSADALDALQLESTQEAIAGLIGDEGGPEPHQGQLQPTPSLIASLEQDLQPLDVLLDKSRWRSFDKLIPGYFTHVGIWVGSERQLRDLGLWEHPAVLPHQRDIQAGKRILEAVRSGVRLNDVEVFLNLDDLALLRPNAIDPKARLRALERSFAQIGKEYDFNFDVETTDRLVCSEIPYAVFRGIEWPTLRLAGRTTISPDNVARQALGDGAFDLYRLFIEGVEIKDAKGETFRALFEE